MQLKLKIQSEKVSELWELIKGTFKNFSRKVELGKELFRDFSTENVPVLKKYTVNQNLCKNKI